ncbi:hypothetical protein TRICI_000278 [Trichomonascus ciferrii]|uniref:GPI transamidase component GAB1 n=1 Tax=Trichomonascus ciferrii TaxID=44093 RepID=A0A642VDW5_9ASCO|nr:hypothetical protein TRICI_000278 [Trichomonascus ciferrii]
MEKRTIGVLLAGVIVRIVLFERFPELSHVLDGRVECSTPVSSFKRMKEGIYQHTHGADPYNGGVFHQSPLLLALFTTLHDVFGSEDSVSSYLYALVDLVVGVALVRIVTALKKQGHAMFDPATVAAIYLFNPFTLLSTLAKSTVAFSNATVAVAVVAATTHKPLQAMLVLALAAVLSGYPLYLLPALATLALKCTPPPNTASSSSEPRRATGVQGASPLQNPNPGVSLGARPQTPWARFARGVGHVFNEVSLGVWGWAYVRLGLVFALAGGLFLLLSYQTTGNWNFVSSVYGTILFFSDLTPNIGLWWYFFTEMFEFFRSFFMGVFQIYVAAFALPLAIRFKDNPLFALATMTGIATLLKSYPEVGDIGFYFTLLALCRPIFPLLKYGIPVTLALLYSAALAPTFYHLWIYLGSGNANFFYAITLVYALAMTIMLSDSVWAAIRLQYDGGKNPNLSQI